MMAAAMMMLTPMMAAAASRPRNLGHGPVAPDDFFLLVDGRGQPFQELWDHPRRGQYQHHADRGRHDHEDRGPSEVHHRVPHAPDLLK